MVNEHRRSAAADALGEARRLLEVVLADEAMLERVEAWADLLHERLRAGRKVMVCGNGGSACDAAHFAEELTGRFRKDRRALAAIACTDAGHITCTANDYGFGEVFSRWVEALGQPGDVLIVLSTSGGSENVRRAAATGRERGLTTLALLGRGGGALKGECDGELIVPGEASDRVQELHMVILHVLVEGVERRAFPGLYA
jgi:D-sedoheptulose 7-phosphate isomerase